jgi:hypothetical protein
MSKPAQRRAAPAFSGYVVLRWGNDEREMSRHVVECKGCSCVFRYSVPKCEKTFIFKDMLEVNHELFVVQCVSCTRWCIALEYNGGYIRDNNRVKVSASIGSIVCYSDKTVGVTQEMYKCDDHGNRALAEEGQSDTEDIDQFSD